MGLLLSAWIKVVYMQTRTGTSPCTGWGQSGWRDFGSTWNQGDTCVHVWIWILYSIVHIHTYLSLSIYIYIYLFIFKHYVYLVYIHPNISCRPFVVYLRFRQQAQHVSRTLLCSQSPKTCAFFRQVRHPGARMTQITHPKKLTQKMTHNGSVQHLFFGFTSKTRLL